MQKKLISPHGIIYAGLDESNHGRYPETFALTLTSNKNNVVRSQDPLSKIRYNRTLKNILRSYKRSIQKDFRFTFATRMDYSRHEEEDYLGNIMVSLFKDSIEAEDFFSVSVFIDGTFSEESINRAKENLYSHCRVLKGKSLCLVPQPKQDVHLPLVNDADAIAHYYFKKTLEEISGDERYRPFLF